MSVFVPRIPFNRVFHSDEEVQFSSRVIRSGQTAGNGTVCRQIESELEATHPGSKVLLTTSCTHALELAALLIDTKPGDEIIVPSFGFVSVANAFILRGARVVFADVEPSTLCLDIRDVHSKINEKTSAICHINYNGSGPGLSALRDLADSNGLWLIEDNAHGLFGTIDGRAAGNYGHLAVTSFHQTKNFSCGEGGAIFLNSPFLGQRAEILREKGTDRSRFFRGEVDKYTWQDVGSSWVLSEVQAGLLWPQLENRSEIIADRRAVWDRYRAELEDWSMSVNARLPPPNLEVQNTGHVFWIVFESMQKTTEFISHMQRRGIAAVVHYQSLHTSPYFSAESQRFHLPVTEMASDCLVRLPIFRGISSTDVDDVIDAARSFES